jgi:hypothetical protein
MTSFTSSTFQNEYLPAGECEMHAIVTVAASTSGESTYAPLGAELLIVDVSGSMASPRDKIQSAREATSAAIECIRDGVSFAVVAGANTAYVVYPRDGELVVASEATRSEAKAAVKKLRAAGGTAIGEWLLAANDLFRAKGGALNHAILLTDGQDEGEEAVDLERAIDACTGVFQCDCRGVGTDWRVSELRQIASALLGTVDIIPEPEQMTADFTAMMAAAMGKSVADVRLRLWIPQGASVVFVKQVAPTIEDLTEKATSFNELTTEYPTGAWGTESRDFHVCIRVRAREIGEEMLAGRVSLIVDDEVVSQSLVRVVWTDDVVLSTRINREVAHYTGQAELAQVIQDGLAARKAGDTDTATVKLGRAVQLATAGGNDATMKLLNGVVEIENPEEGTVKLRRSVDAADEMALDTRSTKTTRIEIGQ